VSLEQTPPQPSRLELGMRRVRERVLTQRAEAGLRKRAGVLGPAGLASQVEQYVLDDVTRLDEGVVGAVLLGTSSDEDQEISNVGVATLDRGLQHEGEYVASRRATDTFSTIGSRRCATRAATRTRVDQDRTPAARQRTSP